MGKIEIQTNDQEMLDFFKSLGHKKSVVVCAIIQDCLEKNDGYLPAKIMAETGFTYKQPKRSSSMRKKSVSYAKSISSKRESAHTVKKTVSQNNPVIHTPEETVSQLVQKQTVSAEVEPVQMQTPETVQKQQNNISTSDDDNYISKSGPVISNPETVLKGLSYFGSF